MVRIVSLMPVFLDWFVSTLYTESIRTSNSPKLWSLKCHMSPNRPMLWCLKCHTCHLPLTKTISYQLTLSNGWEGVINWRVMLILFIEILLKTSPSSDKEFHLGCFLAFISAIHVHLHYTDVIMSGSFVLHSLIMTWLFHYQLITEVINVTVPLTNIFILYWGIYKLTFH